MPINGWMGKILRVDLTSGKIKIESLDKQLTNDFIGGRGINSKILYDETGSQTDPFGPENIIIIGTSPLTGTMVPTACRFTVTSKSPLTGILGDANSGGFFGPELKYAGYDFLIISGISNHPVYLLIDDESVEIRDAAFLWGNTTFKTDELLKKEIGDSRFKVLAIGPAGENLVKIAGIVTGMNIAARCGLGAVMGSKRLKAIAVKGSKTINIAHPDKMLKLVDQIFSDYKNCESWNWYPKKGWTTGLRGMAQSGCAPIKNYMESGGTDLEKRKVFFDVEDSGKYKFKDTACFSCPLACNKWIQSGNSGIKKAPVAGTGHMPILDIYDYPFQVEVNDLCEAYGLDIYSIQGVIAAAMEWFEKGIITKKDTEGLEVSFGNKNSVIELIHKIARRQGFGNILAEGSIKAGKIVGADPDTTPACGAGKGTDHGPIDCTSMAGLTLALCVSTRGGGHLRCTPPMSWGVQSQVPEKWKEVYRKAGVEKIIDKPWVCHPVIAEIVTYFEEINTLADVLEICKNTTEYYYFYGYEGMEKKDDFERFSEWIESVTGMVTGRSYLQKVARRVITLEKSYNVREGKLRQDDMPSVRFLQRRKGGPLDGKSLNKKKLKLLFDEYYRIHGWDPDSSIPTRKTLDDLGLNYIA